MKRTIRVLALFLMLTFGLMLVACDKTNKEDEKEKQTIAEIKEDFLKSANEVQLEGETVKFKDANETEFELKKGIDNVVVLYGSFTTLWYEAGGTVSGLIGGKSSIKLYKEYIGRDITKDEGVETLAQSAAGKNWDVERILAKKPNLIICAVAMSGYKTISGPAKGANIPCVAVKYDNFSDYLKWFKVFSHLNNKGNLYEEVALKALDKVSKVIAETKKLTSLTVFNIFSGAGNFKANTKNTLVGSMINELNSNNITDSWENTKSTDRLEINLEIILQSKPKLILVQCHEEAEKVKVTLNEVYGNNALWKQIVKDMGGEDKIIYLEPFYFHYKPNSRFADAYLKLAEVLYPEHDFSKIK